MNLKHRFIVYIVVLMKLINNFHSLFLNNEKHSMYKQIRKSFETTSYNDSLSKRYNEINNDGSEVRDEDYYQHQNYVSLYCFSYVYVNLYNYDL